jgi:hypothetical protein
VLLSDLELQHQTAVEIEFERTHHSIHPAGLSSLPRTIQDYVLMAIFVQPCSDFLPGVARFSLKSAE